MKFERAPKEGIDEINQKKLEKLVKLLSAICKFKHKDEMQFSEEYEAFNVFWEQEKRDENGLLSFLIKNKELFISVLVNAKMKLIHPAVDRCLEDIRFPMTEDKKEFILGVLTSAEKFTIWHDDNAKEIRGGGRALIQPRSNVAAEASLSRIVEGFGKKEGPLAASSSSKQSNIDPRREFMKACKLGLTDKIKELITEQDAGARHQGLLEICGRGHLEALKILLEYVNINDLGHHGIAPLRVAVEFGQTKISEFLIGQGANCNINKQDIDKVNEQDRRYVEQPLTAIIRRLSNMNILRDGYPHDSLKKIVIKYLELIKLLLENGANPEPLSCHKDKYIKWAKEYNVTGFEESLAKAISPAVSTHMKPKR